MTIMTARAAGFALLLAGLAPVLAGCNEPKDASASAPAEAAEPEVSVVTVKQQARAVVRELPGRIAPTRWITVAAISAQRAVASAASSRNAASVAPG